MFQNFRLDYALFYLKPTVFRLFYSYTFTKIRISENSLEKASITRKMYQKLQNSSIAYLYGIIELLGI